MDEQIYKIAEKMISAVIKNPPEFYNGQQCFKIPSTIFKEFEDIIRVSKFSKEENSEEENIDNNITDQYSPSPIMFV